MSVHKPPDETSAARVPEASELAAAFEAAAKAGWEHRRSKWTQPEWDRLPIEWRLVIVAKTRVAVAEIVTQFGIIAALDEAREMASRHRIAALDFKYRGGSIDLPTDDQWHKFGDRIQKFREALQAPYFSVLVSPEQERRWRQEQDSADEIGGP